MLSCHAEKYFSKHNVCSVASCVFDSLASTSDIASGQVEHSERMPPVSPSLAPGEQLDRSALPSVKAGVSVNHWYKVPNWLAGRWHKDTQTDYYRYNYATHQTDVTTRVEEAKSDGIWGTQIDDQGQIWQFDTAPFVTSVDAGDQTVLQIVKTSEPVEVSDSHFVRRTVDTQVRIDKATNTISSVETGEQFSSYLPESEGLIKRESSSKVFDRFGQAVVLGKSFSYEQKTEAFVPQNFYQGQDLRPLFKQFIDSQKQSTPKGATSNLERYNLSKLRTNDVLARNARD